MKNVYLCMPLHVWMCICFLVLMFQRFQRQFRIKTPSSLLASCLSSVCTVGFTMGNAIEQESYSFLPECRKLCFFLVPETLHKSQGYFPLLGLQEMTLTVL